MKKLIFGGLALFAALAIYANTGHAASSSNYLIKALRVRASTQSYTDGTVSEATQDTRGSAHVAGFGSAGTADPGVVTVQGIAAGTTLNTSPAAPTDVVNCYVATTATTSTQITGCEVATGKSIYITTACISGDILSATATPFVLQSGTSTTCSGPHVLWSGWHPALTNYCAHFPTPIKVTASEGLCLLDSTAGSKAAMVSGFVR